MHSIQRSRPTRNRVLIRCFVLTMSAVMLLDITPWGVLPNDLPKRWLVQVTCRLGIEQGQWSMFPPNPATKMFWWTANITEVDGTSTEWSSAYWATCDGRQKFFQYRHMIYDDRLAWPQFHPATEDFARFLARQDSHTNSPLSAAQGPGCRKVVLYSNTLELIRPEDGQIPSLDNLTFVASSEAVARSD